MTANLSFNLDCKILLQTALPHGHGKACPRAFVILIYHRNALLEHTDIHITAAVRFIHILCIFVVSLLHLDASFVDSELYSSCTNIVCHFLLHK